MSQQSLQFLLGDIKKNYAKEFEDAKAGKNPNGDWADDLPLDREYRIEVEKSEFKQSKAGNPQIVVTYVVLEPAEYAGSKFQDYQGLKPTTTVGSEILSKFLGTMQADLDMSDEAEFGAQFTGKVVVAALRTWGTDNDRIGTRYINIDNGQTLSTQVKPPKSKGGVGGAGLTADISILKVPGLTPAAPPITPPPPPTQATVTPPPAPPAGVNLPPGLNA